ncbi:MAG: hypothetical protein ACOYLQ_01810, partial [Hyphomicrobiaceae bacterium]
AELRRLRFPSFISNLSKSEFFPLGELGFLAKAAPTEAKPSGGGARLVIAVLGSAMDQRFASHRQR